MSVTVRKKPIKNGQMQSIYLDIYQDGFRTKETLDLKLYTNASPKAPVRNNHNTEVKTNKA